MQQPHVVIAGGGFAGLHATRALRHAPVSVTVVDRHNYHLFQPLLYQVATAGLSPGDIASPIRWIHRHQPNVRTLLADVRAVDPGGHRLVLDEGDLAYDYLVLGVGSSHAYFGHDEWQKLAPGLKDLNDALEIRRRVLLAFERAERALDPETKRTLLTFVIVGGGPTGVELAGALAEIARHALAHEFATIDPGTARIILLEGGPDILGMYPQSLREAAARSLVTLGVEVRTRASVTEIDECGVDVGGQRIEAGTVLWAAGVAASPVARSLGVPLDRVGRVLVQPDLSIPGHPEIFVVGDLAAFTHQGGQPLPGVAQVAIQEGRHAARNIVRTLEGRPREPFHYRFYGDMATIGRAAAIADFGRLRISGYVAWLAWLFVHIMNLIGFRNRLVVFIQWAWAYLTYQRSVRLITGPTGAPAPVASKPPCGPAEITE
jgi:NADH dehydrogenase